MFSRSGKPRKRMKMRCGAAGATVFLMMLAAAFGGTDQAEAGPFLFCANPGNTTVTQIDIGTRQITVVMDINDGLTGPSESTIDSDGNLYIANVSSPDILRLSKDGQVSVFVTGQGILNEIKGLAFDSQGDLFIASNGIYKFDVNSSTLTLLSHVTSANPLFNVIEDIEFDHDGNFYAASGRNIQGLGAIVKFDPQGNASVFATGLQNPRDLAVDNLGHLYVANMVGEVVNRLDLSSGSIQLFADLSQASGDPRGVKTDSDNNVYVLNSNGDIRKWNSAGLGGNVVLQSGSSFSEALAFSLTPILHALQVAIDIKPGESPNSINPNSQGVTSVAILTTAIFDASTVNAATVRFGATGTEAAPVRVAVEDVNSDGRPDLLLQFRTMDTDIACGDTSASLTGQTFSGQGIEGTDAIQTVGCR
jgi:sugar lactone lactonase YvrE